MGSVVAQPCPFCENGSLTVQFDPQEQIDVVVCSQCGAKGPLYTRMIPKEDMAIDAWNMRGGQRLP